MTASDLTTHSTPLAGKQTEVAVLAGGCFWGVEDILRAVPGVLDTDVGYTGGWLEKWFFKLHDPTTLNRQGNDTGTQYRSAIFPQSPEQKAAAERVIARVNASGKWKRPITTSIEPASTWYSAEKYHQDYLKKNPGGYTCHFMRD